jgi:hypothetical protein
MILGYRRCLGPGTKVASHDIFSDSEKSGAQLSVEHISGMSTMTRCRAPDPCVPLLQWPDPAGAKVKRLTDTGSEKAKVGGGVTACVCVGGGCWRGEASVCVCGSVCVRCARVCVCVWGGG